MVEHLLANASKCEEKIHIIRNTVNTKVIQAKHVIYKYFSIIIMEGVTSIRLSKEEKLLAMQLAEYFYIKGYIRKPTLSDLIRFSLLFMNKFYIDVENIINNKLLQKSGEKK